MPLLEHRANNDRYRYVCQESGCVVILISDLKGEQSEAEDGDNYEWQFNQSLGPEVRSSAVPISGNN